MTILPLITTLLLTQQIKHEVRGQSVELLGVGRIASGVFEGWSPDGRPDEGLTVLVNRMLSKVKDQSRVWALYPGKKNRCLVVRQVTTSPERPMLSLGATSESWPIELRTHDVYEGKDIVHDTIRLQCFAVEASARLIDVSISESDWIEPKSGLLARPGTKCSIRNAEFVFLGVETRPTGFGPRWNYKVRVLKTDELEVNLWPMTRGGESAGSLVSRARHINSRQIPFNPVPQRNSDPKQLLPTGISFAGGGMEPFVYFSLRKLGEFESDLSLDPKLVHHFAVSAGWGRVVSTGSITLDPVVNRE